MKKNRRPKPRPPTTSTTDWGGVAEWYDKLVGESGSEYQREVVLPGILRLLAIQPGQRVLDVACGQGVLCRLLTQRGATAVGVDAAADLIKSARERSPASDGASPKYYIGDARDLTFLSGESFDSAVCSLSIQNIHPIGPVFQSAARVLKPMGRLVIVMMHPVFRSPKETSWGWDEENKVQYRRVDRYLLPRKHPITTHPGEKTGQYTWTFHKPLEAYVRALRGAGFLIDALEEWPSHKTSTSGGRAAAENLARKEIPMFLAVRSVKVAGIEPQAAPEEQ